MCFCFATFCLWLYTMWSSLISYLILRCLVKTKNYLVWSYSLSCSLASIFYTLKIWSFFLTKDKIRNKTHGNDLLLWCSLCACFATTTFISVIAHFLDNTTFYYTSRLIVVQTYRNIFCSNCSKLHNLKYLRTFFFNLMTKLSDVWFTISF